MAPDTADADRDSARASVRQMFETRSHSWHEVGLARQLSPRRVRRARIAGALLLPLLIAGAARVRLRREELFGRARHARSGSSRSSRCSCSAGIARDLGRVARADALPPHGPGRPPAPSASSSGCSSRRRDRSSRCASPASTRATLAVGGAFTAVIVGLAAQQTLGNLFAGIVLLSARPFVVGDRVRLQGGDLAGQIEGVVSSLGLLYTTLVQRRRLDHGPEPRAC